MREIKFRSFDKNSKEYARNTKLGNYEYSETLNGIFEDENIVFEQFTGLHDKNGVEIYEGDVCCVTGHFDPELELDDISEIGIVSYTDACFVVASGENQFLLFDKDLNFEVIGNIHQTPELIK